jgi:hypothetical protein
MFGNSCNSAAIPIFSTTGFEMPNLKIHKNCKKCKNETAHRFVKNKTNGYYACLICLENNSKKYRDKYRLRYLAQKANARKKENSEIITEEMLHKIYNQQNKTCALTGICFDMSSSLYKPSLDRIDSSKGYKRGNLQLVLFIVNKMKRELDEAEFLNICALITDNRRLSQIAYGPYYF